MLCLLTLGLSACIKPYTPSVQQGNDVTQQQVAQLKLGMSQDDIQYLMGQPILQPTFNNNQWDYIYTYQPPDQGPISEKRISLYFNSQGQLIRIKDDTIDAKAKN
jgi:outer membrane protein assembly factor BamE